MRKTAKIFTNGGSQAVRLPADFRFTGSEVFIRKDPETGEVILTEKPRTWDKFFAALAAVEEPEDILDLEERKSMIHDPNPFADWEQ